MSGVMRDVIILGSGRSGTSLTAGLLASAGYWMGARLARPNPSNPKGFFEDREVNGINEELLRPVTPWRPPVLRHLLFRSQRWLARVPLEVEIGPDAVTPRLARRMRGVVRQRPLCFKDPRFCYTLEAWRPLLPDAVYVCVFREPSHTAASMLRECRERIYLSTLRLDRARALEVWRLMYLHVLRRHSRRGRWLFLHYDQVLRGDGFERLAEHTGAPVDASFPELELQRSRCADPVPAELEDLYRELCARAGYDPEKS